MSEWAEFYGTLNRVGPQLLEGVPEELKGFIEHEARETDGFYSDGLHAAFDYWTEHNYEKAARQVLQEWAHKVRGRLRELLGADSLFPFEQIGMSQQTRGRLLVSVDLIKVKLNIRKLAVFIDAMLLEQNGASAGPILLVQGLLSPIAITEDGKLVRALAVPWQSVVNALKQDWSKAYQIPPERWEEIIAGAFDKAGYDEVVLTPRSRDYGRDVIAVKRGVGSIRLIDSVKAYKPGHQVRYDDVRALAGVLLGDQQASKGIVTTTSTFAPGIENDRYLRQLMPYRLELMNGQDLRRWLEDLAAET